MQKTLILLIAIISCAYFTDTKAQQVFKSNLQSDSGNEIQNLGVKDIQRGNGVYVTSPKYDNIGQILDNINFKYKPYQNDLSDARMVFLNCGTTSLVAVESLREFVNNGGVLYASDLTDKIIDEAFPGLFNFSGKGSVGHKTAKIKDGDLSYVLGEEMEIHFDLSGWAVLNSINEGSVLMEADGKPVMVSVPYGSGRIFYTCFHNHKQASEKEEALLQLLLTKQVQQLAQLSFKDTAKEMGLNLDQMKKSFN